MLTPNPEETLSFVSFNARGLSNPIKTRTLFHYLRSEYQHLAAILLQETHTHPNTQTVPGGPWPTTSFASSLTTAAGGVSIHLNPAWVNKLPHPPTFSTIIPGRAISCTLTTTDGTLCHLINIYAPTKATERNSFFKQIHTHIQSKWIGDQLIIGGDFNTVLDPGLDRRSQKTCSRERETACRSGHQGLEDLVTLLDLHDILRKQFPHAALYTCREVSRIDRWYTTGNIADSCLASKPATAPVASDHSMIALTINPQLISRRGPGTWKANEKTWRDPEVRIQISDILKSSEIHLSADPFHSWLQLKRSITTVLQQAGQQQALQRQGEITSVQQEIQRLQLQLNTIHRKDHQFLPLQAQLQQCQLRLQQIIAVQYEHAARRARVRHISEGEKYTKYFLSLAKTRERHRSIVTLKDAQGRNVSEPKEKLKVGTQFYSALYDWKDSEEEASNILLQAVPHTSRLTPEQEDSIKQPFTREEIRNWIAKRLGRQKSPGPDGLTGEFYRAFCEDLLPILHHIYNFALEHPKTWSHHFTASQISLIYKKGDSSDIANYRPIALLNSDYKILAGTINTRLRDISPHILLPTQSGFTPGRLITDCIHIVDLTIHKLNQTKSPGHVIFLDQEKAYDRVSHDWLHRCLQFWRFPDNLTALIVGLNTTASARLLIDGFVSKAVPQRSGVRQGCPLSPLLYNLTLEPLNCYLQSEQHSGIKGFRINGTRITHVLYADDTTLFIPEGEGEAFARALLYYQRASGAKLNEAKGTTIPLGKRRNRLHSRPSLPELFRNIPVLSGNDQCRYLGVPVPHRPGRHLEKEWIRRAQTIQKGIQSWAPRATTLQGRIAVVNSILYSQVYYHAAARYISLKGIKTILMRPTHQFLWKNRRFHPATHLLYDHPKYGGFNLTDLVSRFAALRVKALCTILTRSDQTAQTIRVLLASLMPSRGLHIFPLIQGPDLAALAKTKLPQFWKQAIRDTHSSLTLLSPRDPSQWPDSWTPLERQAAFRLIPLWHQPALNTCFPVLEGTFYRNPIQPIGDLAKLSVAEREIANQLPNGTRLSDIWELVQNWARDLDIPALDPPDENPQIALPTINNPAAMLSYTLRKGPLPPSRPIPLVQITAKTAYQAIRGPPIVPSYLPGVWKGLEGHHAPDINTWNQARKQITSSNLPPRLKESRWRFCMGQIPANGIRHQWDALVSPNCPKCGSPNETPEHLIWECPWAALMWKIGNRILEQWPSVPNNPITREEAIWSITSTYKPNPGRSLLIASIGLFIWRQRWTLEADHTPSPPNNHSGTLLLADLTLTFSDTFAAPSYFKTFSSFSSDCPF